MATDDKLNDQDNIPKTFQEALLRYIWPSRFRAILLVIACIGLPALAFNVDFGSVFTDKHYRDNPEKDGNGGTQEQASPDHSDGHKTPTPDKSMPPNGTQANKCSLNLKTGRLFVFSGRDFSSCNFSKHSFNGYDFAEADLRDANLSGASFIDANFSGARLHRANFAGAKLQRADFNGAIFEKTILSRANLSQAKNLTQQQLDSACGDAKTLDFLPSGLRIQSCR